MQIPLRQLFNEIERAYELNLIRGYDVDEVTNTVRILFVAEQQIHDTRYKESAFTVAAQLHKYITDTWGWGIARISWKSDTELELQIPSLSHHFPWGTPRMMKSKGNWQTP